MRWFHAATACRADRHLRACVDGLRRNRGVHHAKTVLCMVTVVLSTVACSGMSDSQDKVAIRPSQSTTSTEASYTSSDRDIDIAADPNEMSFSELNDGPGVLHLDVSKLLEEAGAMDLLENYIINVPPTAAFITFYETTRAGVATSHTRIGNDAAGEALREFERRLLIWAKDAALLLEPDKGSDVLHESFFESLEECGRSSPWPQVELFVMDRGRGTDMTPDRIQPTFGMSYFEYQQLRHRCARHAATYPTLDENVRDELLAPQRAHYARVILDKLDNETPLVQVPPEYLAEIDELRRDGW